MTLTPEQIEALKPIAGGKSTIGNVSVMYDAKGKLLLPEVPRCDDLVGLLRWLTVVFNLDPQHPVTGGVREGLRGPDGHVVLSRAGAQPLRFEPASRLNNPARLIESISWQTVPTDGPIHKITADHCRQIAHVVRMLCGLHDSITEAQEADAIVADLLSASDQVDGCTSYGTPAQRYEAAMSLRRAVDEITGRRIGPPRYLVDFSTEELIVAVSDLQDAARRHVGSSLPRGWLDARMSTLGWTRISLDGHGAARKSSHVGPHARIFAYRGVLPAVTESGATT